MEAMEGVRQRMNAAKDKYDQISTALEGAAGQFTKPVQQPHQEDRAFNLEQVSDTVGPAFVFLAAVLEKVEPIADVIATALCSLWRLLEPYHPEDLFTALYGILLVFFGGVYMTLIAAFEAAHLFGWQKIKLAFIALYNEWTKARAAFQRDNKLDEDRDGIADVDELDAKALAARRVMVLTKSIDPENVSAAIEGLTMATIAILATLRVKLAKAITLGTAIGEVLNNIFSPFSSRALQYALPDDYEKWIPVINKYGFRYIGMSASWILMRAMTSVFAAMRGSSLLITGVCGYLVRYQYVSRNVFQEGNPLLVAAWGIVALTGLYWQVSSQFRLPFPLNVLLFPVTVAEQMVIVAVGVSSE